MTYNAVYCSICMDIWLVYESVHYEGCEKGDMCDMMSQAAMIAWNIMSPHLIQSLWLVVGEVMWRPNMVIDTSESTVVDSDVSNYHIWQVPHHMMSKCSYPIKYNINVMYNTMYCSVGLYTWLMYELVHSEGVTQVTCVTSCHRQPWLPEICDVTSSSAGQGYTRRVQHWD